MMILNQQKTLTDNMRELVPEVLLETNPKGFLGSSVATNDAIGLDGKGCALREGGGGDACDAGPSSRKRFKETSILLRTG